MFGILNKQKKTKKIKPDLSVLMLSIALIFSKSIFSCDCPTTSKLTSEYCKKYNLIFRGTVKKVSTCNEINHATFKVQELYSGAIKNEIDIYFDCSSECKMNFMSGETWIVYANYIQLNKPKVEFCSRSRKLVDNEIKVATNYIANDLGFNEECDWLKQNLGIKKTSQLDQIKTVDTHRNQLPEREFSLTLILISLTTMAVLIFLLKKILK